MSKRVNLNAIKFDGAGDKITVTNSSDRSKLSFGQAGATEKPFSISAWIFVADVSDDATAGHIAGIAHVDNVEHEYILARGSNSKILFYLYDVGAGNCRLMAASAGTPIADSTWYHVVGTYDGSKSENGLKIYINGAADAIHQTNANGGNYVQMRNDGTAFTIGGYDNGDGYFEDKMADVCIFDKELTATEVAEIYNSGKVKDMTKATTYSNLISWWKLGDDQDAPGTAGIKDYKGVNHGTLQADAAIIAVPSLPTDRIRPEGHVYTSWGRTRQPKNVAGDHGVYIHGGISGAMPKIDPAGASAGYVTENQRFLHLRWKAEQNDKDHEITAYGYSHATGTWSLLYDTGGTQVKLLTEDATVDMVHVFEVSGVDRVYFKSTGEDDLLATDLFAAATSTF